MLRVTCRLRNEHLRVLGLDANKHASATEIKKAFREQTKRHHPDVGGDPEQFKRICTSYNILTGKTFADNVAKESAFYADARSRNPHWEYYYGTSRSRDGDTSANSGHQRKGSEHGKHGAEWANHQGANANYSTRDFYRPYEGSGKSGFTDEEIRDAVRRTRFYFAGKALKHAFLFGGLIYCYASYRTERIESNERARQQGYDAAYWEMRAADRAKGLDQPVLPSYWERKQREMEEARLANEKRRQALGIRNPFDQHAVAPGPRAVSFRGQPFTPDGLAATRRERKGGAAPQAQLLGTDDDDISYEVDDAEATVLSPQ